MDGLFDTKHVAHPLRGYQQRLVDNIRRAFADGHRRVLVQSPTGSGKTRTLAEIVRLATDKGNPSILLAPRRELVYQIAKALEREGVRAGMIMAGEPRDIYAQANVCSFDTVHARAIQSERMQMPDAKLVIVDEAHLAVADGRQEILNHYSDARHVLVTATPARGDGRGLCEIADVLVLGPTMQELIDDGHLLPLHYFAPSAPDLKGMKLNKHGDYQEKALGSLMDKPKLVGDVVDNWMRIAPGHSTVVFCTNRKHSRHVCEEFLARGITAEHVDGETPKDERAQILARVESGETQVLCNVFVASYGLDIPRLSCAVIARPTKNITLYLQMVGRVMRTFEDQEFGIVIDHSGCVAEHGFADEEHPWSLDGTEKIQERIERLKKEGQEPREIVCPACGAAFKGQRDCPRCGIAVLAPSQPVPVHKADLEEVTRGKESVAEKRNRTTPAEVKAQFFGELRQYAKEKGKADGWCAHTYRSMYSVWPNKHRDAPLRPVSHGTLDYIRSRNIAMARSRK